MQLTHRPTKILVTGKSGTGKSTYFTRYVLNSAHDWKFIFDHEGEFQQRLDCGAVYELAGLEEPLQEERWVIYDPSKEFPGETEAAFDKFLGWVFARCATLPGTKLFACDELQKMVGTMSVTHNLTCLLETGRRRGLDCVMISQQPNAIHNRVREQLTEVVTFQQLTDNAIDFLAQIGFDAEQVRALHPGEFWARSLSTSAEARGRVF